MGLGENEVLDGRFLYIHTARTRGIVHYAKWVGDKCLGYI